MSKEPAFVELDGEFHYASDIKQDPYDVIEPDHLGNVREANCYWGDGYEYNLELLTDDNKELIFTIGQNALNTFIDRIFNLMLERPSYFSTPSHEGNAPELLVNEINSLFDMVLETRKEEWKIKGGKKLITAEQ